MMDFQNPNKRRHSDENEDHENSTAKRWPIAASTSTTDLYGASLKYLFECPVCYDYIQSPIFQCPRGHLLCRSCRFKVSRCPSCRGNLGSIRNLAMEKVATVVPFPCKYSRNGCNDHPLGKDKTLHEEVCEYRQYHCPFPGTVCTWRGNLHQILSHLTYSHSFDCRNEESQIGSKFTIAPGTVRWVSLQTCFQHSFITVFEKQDTSCNNNRLRFYSEMIGPRTTAGQFSYMMQIMGEHKTLQWQAPVRCIQDRPDSESFKSSGMIVDISTTCTIIDNDNTSINVRIVKRS